MDARMQTIVINEVETEPLSDYVINFLTSSTKESPYLDFKKILDIRKVSDFPEIAKDIFAFSNYGGGWLLLGWEEYKKNQFVPVGLPKDFELEPANLQTKFNSYSNIPLAIDYKEFQRDFRNKFPLAKEEFAKKINSISNRFAAVFIPPSSDYLLPIKEGKYIIGEKERVVFKEKDLLYRRGTQSIPPSETEKSIIAKRLIKENYKLSLLSGEPDEIEEEIFSNLFEIKSSPKFVFSADIKDYDNASIKVLLKQFDVFPEFYFKFKIWSKKIVTFENLLDPNNPYRVIINEETISKQPIEGWLKDNDKHKVIKEVLNREIKHFAIKNGMRYGQKKNTLYYSCDSNGREESWKTRYSSSKKIVAALFYSNKLKRQVFWHVAFHPEVLEYSGKFYLRILPTFVITEDGKNSISNSSIGPIITKLSYDKYNSIYLNNVLFWIHQLGKGQDVVIKDYFKISKDPVKLKSKLGILYDIPSNEFKLELNDGGLDIEIDDE